MYRIAVTFRCLPGKREEFLERVKAEGIREAVLSEDGCHAYDYYLSDADASELLLIEAWETRRHQEVHIEQPHMARLRSFKAEYIESTTLQEFELK
jgi:quinol monooxygenase YgiN